MHTCMHAYMNTCISTYMHTCTHAYMHACMHAFRHACIHAASSANSAILAAASLMQAFGPCLRSMSADAWGGLPGPDLRMCMCMCMCVYVYVHVYVCMYVHVHVYMCMHMHVCVYVCMCVYVCICVCVCIHAVRSPTKHIAATVLAPRGPPHQTKKASLSEEGLDHLLGVDDSTHLARGTP